MMVSLRYIIREAVEPIKPFLIRTINIILLKIQSAGSIINSYAKTIRQFLKRFLYVLKLLIDNALKKSDKYHYMAINIPENSSYFLRDIIMLCNSQETNIPSETLEKIEVQFVVSPESVSETLDKVFTFSCLDKFIGNVHFMFKDNCLEPAEYNRFCVVFQEDELPSMDISERKIDTVAKLNTGRLLPNCNFLDVPFSKSAWAWNTLKSYKPSSIFCCFSFGHYLGSDHDEAPAQWRDFFITALETFPRIQFFILDDPWPSCDSLRSMPNVLSCNMLGYSVLEKVSIVHTSDMFLGAYDEYAITLRGTLKPCLFYCDEFRGRLPIDGPKEEVKLIEWGKQQLKITPKLVPQEILADLKEFYKTYF